MGVYSTLRVSRKAALAKIDQLQKKRKPTNEELEEILEGYLMQRTLYNFMIVDDEDAEDDGTLGSLLDYELNDYGDEDG